MDSRSSWRAFMVQLVLLCKLKCSVCRLLASQTFLQLLAFLSGKVMSSLQPCMPSPMPLHAGANGAGSCP